MTDPKTFTGPEGWTFRIAGKNVFIGNLNGDFPVGVIVPLAELGAFLQQPETAAAFEALAPAKPIDFRAGTFTRPGEPFSLDGGQTYSGLRGPVPQSERTELPADRFHAPDPPPGGNYSNVLPAQPDAEECTRRSPHVGPCNGYPCSWRAKQLATEARRCTCPPGCVSHQKGCPRWVLPY